MDIFNERVLIERLRLRHEAGPSALKLHTEESWAELIRCHVREGRAQDFQSQMLAVAALALEALESHAALDRDDRWRAKPKPTIGPTGQSLDFGAVTTPQRELRPNLRQPCSG